MSDRDARARAPRPPYVHATTKKAANSLALVRTNYNVIFVLFGAVGFHTALFASEPEIVNKTTFVLRSFIHWFIHSTVPEFVWNRTETISSGGSQCGCLVCTRV